MGAIGAMCGHSNVEKSTAVAGACSEYTGGSSCSLYLPNEKKSVDTICPLPAKPGWLSKSNCKSAANGGLWHDSVRLPFD